MLLPSFPEGPGSLGLLAWVRDTEVQPPSIGQPQELLSASWEGSLYPMTGWGHWEHQGDRPAHPTRSGHGGRRWGLWGAGLLGRLGELVGTGWPVPSQEIRRQVPRQTRLVMEHRPVGLAGCPCPPARHPLPQSQEVQRPRTAGGREGKDPECVLS